MLLTPLLLSLLPSLATPTPPQEDERLEPLAAALRAYFEARSEGDELAPLKAEVVSRLQALAGKDHPLEKTEDIGRAFWLVRERAKTKLRPGKVTETTSPPGSFGHGGLDYAFRVPRDYDPARTYPMIVAVPDEGERPADHIRSYWSSAAFRKGAIVVSPAMPPEVEEWDKVMVNGRPGGLTHVLTALRVASDELAVDFDRVFVAGFDRSVPAALAAGNFGPQRFAGVIGRRGDASGIDTHNFRTLPTLFVRAGEEAQAFQEAARSRGIENCDLQPAGNEESVWQWIEARERSSFPEEVEVAVGKPFPTRVAWLRVSPIAPSAHSSATIDRDKNRIEVQSQGASHVILYLNDELVDLDRPLVIVRNGTESEASVERSVAVMLDLLSDGTSDPGCVYTAELVLDMREEALASAVEASAKTGDDFERRLEEAGDDVARLWELHRWCEDAQRTAESRIVLRRLVRCEPGHAQAREALGHRAAGEQWFTSEAAFQRFQKSQDPELAAQRGHVLHKGFWMHPDEKSYANKGLVKDWEAGTWLTQAERKRLAAGWVRQDLDWVAPEDAHHVDAGEWWVDGEWLALADAERRHARIDRMWHVPGGDVLLHTTVRRRTAANALVHMTRAIGDLRKVFGVEPPPPLEVVLLRDEEQYDRFAFGDPDGRRPPTHAGRLHVIHAGFFAESRFERVKRKSQFAGTGVTYWNADIPHGDAYGVHAARFAVGLSFVEALDPSKKAVRRAASRGMQPEYYDEYQAEKKLPAWLRYGAAVYAERYFVDDQVAEGGDPLWARKWSLDNLTSRGGLRPLDEVLAFRLDPDERGDGLKLLLEAGLVVAFLVDGTCAPVQAEHEALKRALAAGRVHAKRIEALEEALRANESELRAFGGP